MKYGVNLIFSIFNSCCHKKPKKTTIHACVHEARSLNVVISVNCCDLGLKQINKKCNCHFRHNVRTNFPFLSCPENRLQISISSQSQRASRTATFFTLRRVNPCCNMKQTNENKFLNVRETQGLILIDLTQWCVEVTLARSASVRSHAASPPGQTGLGSFWLEASRLTILWTCTDLPESSCVKLDVTRADHTTQH